MLAEIADDVVGLILPFVGRRIGRVRRIARAEGEDLVIYEVVRGEVRRSSATPDAPRRQAVHGELQLPAESVLTKTLSLPAATRGYLEQVLDHRLEKLTPWAPDRVVYGYGVAGEGDGGSISVRFAATAREVADAWIAKAEALGFTPTSIGAATDPMTEPLAVDLWRGSRDVLRKTVGRMVAVAAVIAIAVPLPLLGASIWTVSASEDRLQALEARTAAARGAMHATGPADGREAALIAAKTPESAMVTLIDRLADAIPDSAALRELEIDPQRIRLSGSSQAAPELLGLLENSGVLVNARFGAPVTRNADGRDGFEILAERRLAQPAARP